MTTSPRVLVVEDHTDGRESLVDILEFQGYDVTSVADGAAGLAQLCGAPFEAVVLDLGLPDIDGVEVIRAARARSAAPAILVFTGFHRLKDAAEAAGCDAFILKPELEQLLASLGTMVAARASYRVPGPEARKEHG